MSPSSHHHHRHQVQLAVDTDVNHEMLTPQWKENEIIDVIPVQLEADTQPQSSKRRKNKDEDTYKQCKKKI